MIYCVDGILIRYRNDKIRLVDFGNVDLYSCRI